MSLSFEQLSFYFKEFVQSLKFQISSSTQETQIDIECPPRGNREHHYGYCITQDFILAFENEIKKFINPANFHDPACASLTRNWLIKELRLRQLDYKCCVDLVLEPEDSADEDSEGEVEGLADNEDDTKTDEDEGGPTDHEDTKEDKTNADEQESSLYEDEKGNLKTDEEADTIHYEDEKDDDTKTDEEADTFHFEDEKEDDPKTDEGEGDPTHFEDEKEDDPKTDEDKGNASRYEDEKDDDSKTDEYEAVIRGHNENIKDDEDEGYTSHDYENETSAIGYADDEFEVEYDAEEVVVVLSVCSDDPISFQARPTQAQMDMMTTLFCQPPQWWEHRDIDYYLRAPISELPFVTPFLHRSTFASPNHS
ncbi:uncharacterized protein HD556DRAFT_1314837 [Suillus plorans]|uniref:Uncharacterized protein n=1 Tax=Suillus plorans TaxID=116603 RepID=A0A9P7A9Q8_9AGAM|nr:uncharacterized protein HD556DRAFT_1314837 [Suillus plorans]KAG1784708.1 hypothetical protein HD556DRAFT_1314837 [Suillus plorans]